MPSSVLIVDDCPPMRSVIRRMLEISGFPMEECYFAGDGDDALSLLRRHRVDLIISDVYMPGLDGEGMLRRLAEDENLRRVPVVFVSTDGTQGRISRLLEMGARGYVVKPFQPGTLLAELKRALGTANA